MGSEKREKIHGMNCEPEEEEEEEEQIEKFFALIRSFRDARDRRRNELKEQSKKPKKRKAEHDHENPQSSWVPKFRLEDFTQEIEFKSLPLKYPMPCNKNHKDSVLDLKLTL
ncbi:Protein translocase subunit SecA like [Actinidia chinensis var. chinensis]|uniref:Protein translocase subunit SecA like n=1 Tax=Actinidia chinensis var. chinensis TaxID=1590841 RepID=A0A2R6PCW4_ACTCC|nr:Protein translocase subunit SecA like [Actinidia chinensis var. chinensis]